MTTTTTTIPSHHHLNPVIAGRAVLALALVAIVTFVAMDGDSSSPTRPAVTDAAPNAASPTAGTSGPSYASADALERSLPAITTNPTYSGDLARSLGSTRTAGPGGIFHSLEADAGVAPPPSASDYGSADTATVWLGD